MLLKEAIDKGVLTVGNLITLANGQVFLVGDCTPFEGPSKKTNIGWESWYNIEVINVVNLLDNQQVFMHVANIAAATAITP